MTQLTQSNFFIFTGGPGAGKTTVLNELRTLGYPIVPEAARDIIKTQILKKGNALHTGDRNAFRDLMLAQSILDFQNRCLIHQPVFFDRGIPDLQGYSEGFCSQENPDVLKAIELYRYNPRVFIFPPWLEIYSHDTERKQDFQEAIQTFQALKKAYLACGYQLIEVPKISVAERVTFILQRMKD